MYICNKHKHTRGRLHAHAHTYTHTDREKERGHYNTYKSVRDSNNKSCTAHPSSYQHTAGQLGQTWRDTLAAFLVVNSGGRKEESLTQVSARHCSHSPRHTGPPAFSHRYIAHSKTFICYMYVQACLVLNDESINSTMAIHPHEYRKCMVAAVGLPWYRSIGLIHRSERYQGDSDYRHSIHLPTHSQGDRQLRWTLA